MQRAAKFSPNKLPVDSQRLVTLAQETTKAATYFERVSWEKTLRKATEKLLKNKRQETLDGALDNLLRNDLSAYDMLLETIESLSESCRIEHDGKKYDALLIAAPVLAWTHYAIPSGEIPNELHAQFEKYLKENILAENARLLLQPSLYSIDQLPMTHTDTFKLTRRLANALLTNVNKQQKNRPQTIPFLADTRYLIGIAVTQTEETFFSWQALSTPTNAPVKRKTAFRADFDGLQHRTSVPVRVLSRMPPSRCKNTPVFNPCSHTISYALAKR